MENLSSDIIKLWHGASWPILCHFSYPCLTNVRFFFLFQRLHFEPSFFQNRISELDHTHFTPTSFPLLAKQKCMRVQPINIFPWKNLAAQSNSVLKCIGGIDDIFCGRKVINITEGMVNDGLGKWRWEGGCLNVRYDDPLQANGQQRKRRKEKWMGRVSTTAEEQRQFIEVHCLYQQHNIANFL